MAAPLFFSGGSALKALCIEMARRGQNSYHLLTTHDSGGSSRKLRQSFHMPAIGDIRNRLLALAPWDMRQIVNQLAYRIPANHSPAQARRAFRRIVESDDWFRSFQEAGRSIRHDLEIFQEAAGDRFDYTGASIGNLALAGVWLGNGGNLQGAIDRYEQLLRIVGKIMPSTLRDMHLAAALEDGSLIFGQHLFKDIRSPVGKMWYTECEPWLDPFPTPCNEVALNSSSRDFLAASDVICYPVGSFYSSLLANLLPAGVGEAIAACNVKKIYIPNSGRDPEQLGLNIVSQVRRILQALKKHSPDLPVSSLLNVIMIDKKNGEYMGGFTGAMQDELEEMGIEILDCPIVQRAGVHSPSALLEMLEKIASNEN